VGGGGGGGVGLGMSSALPALLTRPLCFSYPHQLQHLCNNGIIQQSTPCAGKRHILAACQRRVTANFTNQHVEIPSSLPVFLNATAYFIWQQTSSCGPLTFISWNERWVWRYSRGCITTWLRFLYSIISSILLFYDLVISLSAFGTTEVSYSILMPVGASPTPVILVRPDRVERSVEPVDLGDSSIQRSVSDSVLIFN